MKPGGWMEGRAGGSVLKWGGSLRSQPDMGLPAPDTIADNMPAMQAADLAYFATQPAFVQNRTP
jgi:hypothetical protein